MTKKTISRGTSVKQQLERRLQELTAAQRIAKIGFWRWDTQTNDFSWSDELYRLLSLDPSTFEVTLESTFSLIHPEDRDGTMAILQCSAAEGIEQTHQYRAVLEDGTVVHLWSNIQPIRNEMGLVIEVRGICNDITERVAAEAALRESEDHYRHAVELSPQIPWTASPNGDILEVGPRWLDLMGMTKQETLGNGWIKALHPDDVEPTLAQWDRHLASGEPLDIEYRLQLIDGSYNWMRVRAAARRGKDGKIFRWYGTAEDIQAQKSAQVALLESQTRLAAVLGSTTDSIMLVDCKWRVTYMNPRASEVLMGVTGLAVGAVLFDAFPWHMCSELHEALILSATERRPVQIEVFIPPLALWLDLHAFPTKDGISIFLRDITEVRRAREEVVHLAHYDSLTQLPNRERFLRHCVKVLSTAGDTNGAAGLIYLDLDDFKVINDTLGHDAGDAILVEAARRLEESVPASAQLGRLGSDEFAILLAENVSERSLEQVILEVKAALSAPVSYGDTALSCKASMGVALYSLSDDVRPAELLKNADLALYEAKRAGGNQHAFYTPELRQVMQKRLFALSCARDALARDAIIPFYQPKVSLETGAVCGFEALLRWTDPSDIINPPGLIKDAFEDPILSVELGKRMLERVVADMAVWKQAGFEFGHVALNVSAQEFARTPIADNVLAALRQAQLPSSALEIEVTETVFLGDGSDGVARSLRKLHDHGVCISLDDFGTGYASLTHLSKFPVSWLKIDQSFIREMSESPDAAAIVKAVIGLSRNLGIQVVAEGVETIEQWKELKKRGCDLAQGYLIAKPMSAEALPQFMKTWQGINVRSRGKARSAS